MCKRLLLMAGRGLTLTMFVMMAAPGVGWADPLQPWRVIDRQMIESYHLRSVADAVELVAGFGTVRTYVKQRVPTARGVLQTHYANRVLILINGVPTWHAGTGEGYLERVSIDQVERVEVLLGPGSVTYGTQAYAGVVNLVLRTAASSDDSDVIASVRVGSPSEFEAAGGVTWHTPRWSGSLTGALHDRQGRDTPFTDEAGVTGLVQEYGRSATFAGHGTYTRGRQTHRVLVNAFRSDEAFLGAAPTFALGLGQDHKIDGLLASYAVTFALSDRVGIEGTIAWDDNTRESARSRDNVLRTDIRGDRISGGIAASARLTRASSLRIGVDVDTRHSERYNSFNVRSGAVIDENQMRGRRVGEQAVFGQYGYEGDRLSLTAGTRLTTNENFGSHASISGGVGYRIDSTHAVSLRAGQSYRSPTLFELYFQPAEQTVFGNVDLDPETSETVEVEYTGRAGGFTLRTTAYAARYNQISRTRRAPGDPGDTSLVYTNGANFDATGMEVETRYRAGTSHVTDVFLHYALVAGDDVAFRYVPQHTVTAGASRAMGPWQTSGLLSYRSSTDGPRERIDGQARLDITLGYRQTLNGLDLHHVVAVTNATDATWVYPEYVRQNLNSIPLGFGRAVTYGLRLRF
jgi:outer membrane receptor protein involved in Fe transport